MDRFQGSHSAAIVALVLMPVLASAQAVQQIDLPAQSLERVRAELSSETGWQVSAPAELLADRPSIRVNGVMSPAEALQIIIQGAGLTMDLIGEEGAILSPLEVNGSDDIGGSAKRRKRGGMSAPDTFFLKALIYCRVSTKNQETDGHGLESQETRCRQHSAAKGYEVQAVFRDTVTGGADVAKRTGVAALLSSIDAQPDERFVVIVDDLNRVSRDARAVLDLRDALRLRDVHFECPTWNHSEMPEDALIETVLAAREKWEDALNPKEEAK